MTSSKKITSSSLSQNIKSNLKNLLSNYQSAFQTLVKAQLELGVDLDSGALGRMQQSVEQSDQLVMQLVADTKLQVEASIAKAQSVAIMVFIISLSISRRVSCQELKWKKGNILCRNGQIIPTNSSTSH